MISATFVSIRITPEISRRIEVRVAGDDGLEPLPYAVRFAGHGPGYRRADTGERIVQHIVDWRDYQFAGSQEVPERPSQTPRLDAALDQTIAADRLPRQSDWYRRERPKGDLGDKMAEAMRSRIRQSLLRT